MANQAPLRQRRHYERASPLCCHTQMLSNGGDHTLSQGRPTRKVGFDVTTCVPLSRFVFISFEFPCERRNTLQRSSKLVLPRCAWIALRSRCHGQLKWRLFKDTIIDMLVQPAEDSSTKVPTFVVLNIPSIILPVAVVTATLDTSSAPVKRSNTKN